MTSAFFFKTILVCNQITLDQLFFTHSKFFFPAAKKKFMNATSQYNIDVLVEKLLYM